MHKCIRLATKRTTLDYAIIAHVGWYFRNLLCVSDIRLRAQNSRILSKIFLRAFNSQF